MVDSNMKYLAATNEVSARIQARDQVLFSFIALAAILIGVAFSNNDYFFVMIAIGYAALATTFLIMHHDLIIGHLCDFLRELTKDQDDTPQKQKPTIDWFSSKKYYGRTLTIYRWPRDIAQLIVICLPGLALYFSQEIFTELSNSKKISTELLNFQRGGEGCIFISVLVIVSTMLLRLWKFYRLKWRLPLVTEDDSAT
ncbi:hypothetical protein IH879_11345 [candidate division KSB1 bacterium]|nr:hypothetical protein [candidate division KSB1 bacterium]